MKTSLPLKIVFAGTPDFAAKHLSAVLDSAHPVVAVYTQPDRPSGRGKKLLPSPVKLEAIKHGIPVYQPASLKNESAIHDLTELKPDLLVVVAYGLILPAAILQIPRYGCINVHASLLPRWRGAAPIERALLAADTETGVTIMLMDAGLDTGDMLRKAPVSISRTDTRETLELKLAAVGTRTLVEVLDDFLEIQKTATPQDETQSSYAGKINKEEALIHWDSHASNIHRQIRAGIGRYPAFAFIDGIRVRFLNGETSDKPIEGIPGSIHELTDSGMVLICGNSLLIVDSIQLPGKNPISIRDLLNSNQELIQAGKQFTSSEICKQ